MSIYKQIITILMKMQTPLDQNKNEPVDYKLIAR
jgi:hypothetical protein